MSPRALVQNVTLVTALSALIASCMGAEAKTDATEEPATSAAPSTSVSIDLRSDAFEAGKDIPKKYTCEGSDTSPPLRWKNVPEGTKSLALIVDDPDAPDPKAPKRTWVHWVVFNLPKDSTELSEGGKLPPGAKDGKNDWNRTGYGGPCPPIGRHRYFHKIYALDTMLDLGEPTKADLERAMGGHVLARGELIGTYEKSGK